MKVIIDGIEYVPVDKTHPTAEAIARGLLDTFWGDELPSKYDWESEARNIMVMVSDSFKKGSAPTVMEVAAAILKRLEEQERNA